MHPSTDICLLGLLSNLVGRDLIVVLIIVALIYFGVRNLPDLIRTVRRLPSAFRKGLDDEEDSTVAKNEPSVPKSPDGRE